MTRTCSEATRRKVANLRFTKDTPGWLRAAVSNTRNGSPMSEKQELRMCKALGIPSPKRPSPKRPARRFYRPCLSVELGEQVKLWNIDIEALLTQAVKSAIIDEQWRERTHEV